VVIQATPANASDGNDAKVEPPGNENYTAVLAE